MLPAYRSEIGLGTILIVIVHAIDGCYVRVFLAEGLRKHDITCAGIWLCCRLLREVEDVTPVAGGLCVAILLQEVEIDDEEKAVLQW